MKNAQKEKELACPARRKSEHQHTFYMLEKPGVKLKDTLRAKDGQGTRKQSPPSS